MAASLPTCWLALTGLILSISAIDYFLSFFFPLRVLRRRLSRDSQIGLGTPFVSAHRVFFLFPQASERRPGYWVSSDFQLKSWSRTDPEPICTSTGSCPVRCLCAGALAPRGGGHGVRFGDDPDRPRGFAVAFPGIALLRKAAGLGPPLRIFRALTPRELTE